jgi:hypothetical protein
VTRSERARRQEDDAKVARGEARGYRWEPFQKGHWVSLRHGARSERLIVPRAEEIVEELAETLPGYLAEPSYAPALLAYATTLARIERVAAYLEAQEGGIPEVAADGQVRSATNLLLKLEARAESQRQRLGLDPLSRARLGRDVVSAQVGITDLWAAAEAQREQRAGEGRDG